jgi:prolyl 4-hydroxylase
MISNKPHISSGECENNKNYMHLHCAPSCQTCEQISYDYRCPFDKNAPTALNPGDLDRMFERIIVDFPHHTPTILSSPNTTNGPWVLQLDTFATVEECERLIEQGQRMGYGQSFTVSDVGKRQCDGTAEAVVAQVRTSTNAWCEGECQEDPLVKGIHDRMEKVLGIPFENWEHLQLLKYEESQFYKKHHDFMEHHLDRPQVRTSLWLHTEGFMVCLEK